MDPNKMSIKGKTTYTKFLYYTSFYKKTPFRVSNIRQIIKSFVIVISNIDLYIITIIENNATRFIFTSSPRLFGKVLLQQCF